MLRVLVLLLLAAAPAWASQHPEHIEISRSENGSRTSFPGWRLEAPFLPLEEIELDLGDSIEGQLLIIGEQGDNDNRHRVLTRYETSITIMNEGPHLDLLDWKHYTSEWKDATQVSAHSFKLPVFTDEQASMFPDVTAQEIQEAVLASGGERWANLVRRIQGPRDYPSAVGPSGIWVRIQVWEEGGWTTLTTLAAYPPMGC